MPKKLMRRPSNDVQRSKAAGSKIAPSSPHASATMRANRRRDTSPELRIRTLLHKRGFRYRVDKPLRVEGLVARPDLVFVGPRVAVFVDGCFWHACPIHGELPVSNRSFWKTKLGKNAERDALHTTALTAAGWDVIRVWEHEDAEEAAERIASRLQRAAC
jgi:DNA mismatch endonuclease, patch repair protein